MKKVIFGLFLFMISLLNTEAQWYTRQYNVTDINQLSKPQLELSLVHTKSDLVESGAVAGAGAIGWWLLNYAHVAIIGSYVCAGVFAGGVIFSIGYIERIAKIKSAIRRNYPSASLNISPALILNKFSGSYSSGITLTYSF